MRFGWLAAAGALVCAGQAGAARYYEFEVTGAAIVDLFSPTQALYTDTFNLSIDTALSLTEPYQFYNVGYGPKGFTIGVIYDQTQFSFFTLNQPGGPNFSLGVLQSSIAAGNSLQSVSITGESFSFAPCSSRACAGTFAPGSITSVSARTSDAAPTMLGLSNLITVSPIPEPATWGTMILGFGAIGYRMRRRRAKLSAKLVRA